MNLKLPKIEMNCLKLLKIENWIENCQKINFQFLSLSEKLKIELKIAQNQFSFFSHYWKMKWTFSYTDENRFKKSFFCFSFFNSIIKFEKWKIFFKICFFISNQKTNYKILNFIFCFSFWNGSHQSLFR